MSPKKDMSKSTKSSVASNTNPKGFSDFEKAAMRERARELKDEERMYKDKAAGESAVLEAIAALPEPDRSMAKRLHAIIKTSAPTLSPKTWYGMPAYANQKGNVICFFQGAIKFKARYSTIGFSDKANLDEGVMWATSFALKELTSAEETKIVALVKKAVS